AECFGMPRAGRRTPRAAVGYAWRSIGIRCRCSERARPRSHQSLDPLLSLVSHPVETTHTLPYFAVLAVNTSPPFESRSGAGPPGVGPGWLRVARELATQIPVPELQGIWVFPAVRRDDQEWGTAVVARRGEGGRIRIYTARY